MPTPNLPRRSLLAAGGSAAAALGLASPAFADHHKKTKGSVGEAAKVVQEAFAAAYTEGGYALPPLPYAADALEPHISGQIMTLHHDTHHAGYVKGLNGALADVKALQKDPGAEKAKLAGVMRNLTFNGNGHLLHTLFWATMTPDGGGEPTGLAVGKAIDEAFGSFAAFKKFFATAAGSVKGSGWGLLAYEPVGDALVVNQIADHDIYLLATAVPLLPIDVWEHAFYLQYQTGKASYVDAWMNTINWPAVDAVYQFAKAAVRPGMRGM